jgi:NADPH2:quinone reductase
MERHVIRATDTGGPDVLASATIPLANLADDALRVEVTFAGVNFWDVMQRRGDVPLPADHVPGVEGCGRVIAVGRGADPDMLGQRVAWSRVSSSYSSALQGPQTSFVRVPDEMRDEVAAGCLMQGVTAHYLASSTTDLGPAQSAVVTSAAGGVGRLLTQFLMLRGVTVIGVVSSPTKVAASCANHTLVAEPNGMDQLASALRDYAPLGVDAVFDASGGRVEPLLTCLRPRGICVIYGSASGQAQEVSLSALSAGSFYLTRTAGRDYSATPAEWHSRAEAVLSKVASGHLTVAISDILLLQEARTAHELLESRRTTGKLLLRVPS